MKKINLLCILLLSSVFLASCQSEQERVWSEKGRLIEKYGREFLKQNQLLDTVRWGGGVYSFLIKNAIINVNFTKNTYEVEEGGKVTKYTPSSIEKKFKLNSKTLLYWAGALDELNTYLISKKELLCECVHISKYSQAPFSDVAAGWFYIPNDDDKSKRAKTGRFDRISKIKEGWYWGVLKDMP